MRNGRRLCRSTQGVLWNRSRWITSVTASPLDRCMIAKCLRIVMRGLRRNHVDSNRNSEPRIRSRNSSIMTTAERAEIKTSRKTNSALAQNCYSKTPSLTEGVFI